MDKSTKASIILNKTKKRVQDFVVNNKTKEAFETLLEIFDKRENSKISQDIRTVFSNFNDNESNMNSGTVSHENYMLSLNKIRKALFGYINEITPQEAYARWEIENKQYTQVLIVCREDVEERRQYMKKLFYNYEGVEVTSHEIPPDNVNDFQFIVFDNFSINKASKNKVKFDDYFKMCPDMNFLYFGEHFKVFNSDEEYRDRLFFTNSKFSIHARFKEMVLFLEHEEIRKQRERNS